MKEHLQPMRNAAERHLHVAKHLSPPLALRTIDHRSRLGVHTDAYTHAPMFDLEFHDGSADPCHIFTMRQSDIEIDGGSAESMHLLLDKPTRGERRID